MKTSNNLWTTKEVAEYMGVSEATVWKYAKNGLSYYRLDGIMRFDPHDVSLYLQSLKVGKSHSASVKFHSQIPSKTPDAFHMFDTLQETWEADYETK